MRKNNTVGIYVNQDKITWVFFTIYNEMLYCFYPNVEGEMLISSIPPLCLEDVCLDSADNGVVNS